MEPIDQVKSDLHYVREATQESELHRSPAAIYLYWAIATMIGFSLVTPWPAVTERSPRAWNSRVRTTLVPTPITRPPR